MTPTDDKTGRIYLVGLPVGVTINEDGSISVTVYLEDLAEEIRDQAGVEYGDEDSVAALTMENVETDAIVAEDALVRRDITVSWS